MIATYRLQLHKGFGFADLVGILDILEDLGISHVYTSPTLQATAGSAHGYDVVDHQRINEELGGEAGHQQLSEALAARGMGRIVDLVPNHMAVGPANRWWWDVLENGRTSRYARYFDIDWAGGESGRIGLPILGAPYGTVLDQGEIQVERTGGGFVARYWEHRVPLDPGTLGPLLGAAADACGSDELGFLADSCAMLGAPPGEGAPLERRHRDKEVLRRLLARLLEADPEVRAAVDAQVEAVNGDPDGLHAILDAQHHRLAHWRSGRQELDYRRFFDIDTLVGLRMEEPAVFADTHALVLAHVAAGQVQGLRIDHPDGLRDPAGYLARLRRSAPDAWIGVEKILAPDEALRPDWPVQGTTGYEFLHQVLSLFVDGAGEGALTGLYGAFTGQETDFHLVEVACKHLVMREGLGSELNRLTDLLLTACARHRVHRDHTRFDCDRALRAVIGHFPVYRTYGLPGRVTDADREVITAAVGRARGDEAIEPLLLDFLEELLRFEHPGAAEEAFALSFQQVTGPVMAKGVEDTAFYRYGRLVALNDVGGAPDRFGGSPEGFHGAMQQTSHPQAMRTTSTHDTKRSEDVRVRLAVLSEIPERWGHAVLRWAAHNRQHKAGGLPDRGAEYLLYQTLVGAWPLPADRAVSYMEKAVREAKVHTSWSRPDTTYEEALRGFIEAILEDEGFREELEAFVEPMVQAGRLNSLAQALVLATVPGVPDRYQGTELWDLSLVDPDNRRPVDWGRRRQALEMLRGLDAVGILDRMDEGLPKLHVIRQANRVRARRREAMAGSYRPLPVHGEQRRHVVAYLRGEEVAVVVPRLVVGLCAPEARSDVEAPLVLPERLAGCFGPTDVHLPEGRWRDALTGFEVEGGAVGVDALLDPLPVALLERVD